MIEPVGELLSMTATQQYPRPWRAAGDGAPYIPPRPRRRLAERRLPPSLEPAGSRYHRQVCCLHSAPTGSMAVARQSRRAIPSGPATSATKTPCVRAAIPRSCPYRICRICRHHNALFSAASSLCAHSFHRHPAHHRRCCPYWRTSRHVPA